MTMPPHDVPSESPKPERGAGLGTRGRARTDQLMAVIIGGVLLALAILVQKESLAPRRKQLVREPETSLRSLAVTFPRLTLGGFRGLVAAALWMQAEDDKNNRKWQELETKYDMIASLEPYFISVYIYHAWNQAYNLSAQWHSQDTKYKWVLDGLDYLYKGEDYNPGRPDLILEQAQMFFLKLGASYERIFYRAHWRSDIARLHDYHEDAYTQDPEVIETLRLVHDVVTRVPPENQEAAARTKDPVELQKLNEFHTRELPDPDGSTRVGYGISITDPNPNPEENLFQYRDDGKAITAPVDFRYGLSPFYFAYISYKRVIAAGRPSTVAMRVIDSEPAMSLRMWCKDDMYYSQQLVMHWFGPDDASKGLMPGSPEYAQFQADIANVEDCYRNVHMIAPKAIDEFHRHLLRHPENKYIHPKHIKETRSYFVMAQAESQLLKALILWNGAGRKLTDKSIAAFKACLPLYEDSIATAEIWVNTIYPDKNEPQRMDSEKFVIALRARLAGIENVLRTPPGQTADMSFLSAVTVER